MLINIYMYLNPFIHSGDIMLTRLSHRQPENIMPPAPESGRGIKFIFPQQHIKYFVVEM